MNFNIFDRIYGEIQMAEFRGTPRLARVSIPVWHEIICTMQSLGHNPDPDDDCIVAGVPIAKDVTLDAWKIEIDIEH